MNTFKKIFVATFVALGMVTVSGCSASTPPETIPAPVASEEATPVEAGSDGGSTVALLNDLVVEEEVNDGYDRELFNHWVSKNPTGCDTRVAVLIREIVDGTTAGCEVSGTWVSVYDNETVTAPGDLDIDHMVPLKEAWGSGAHAWHESTREAFANDLASPYTLLAVTASSNRSKSDRDPAEWMPTVMDGCEYVARWVHVKHTWHLSVDQAEKDKILSVLSWCDGDYTLSGTPSTPVVSPEPAQPAPEPAEPVVEPVTPVEPPAPAPAPEPAPAPATDPQYSSCKEATANGFGPYVKGVNPEYAWYQDRDGDGTVCE